VGQGVALFSPIPDNERLGPELEAMVEVRVSRDAKIYKDARAQVTSNSLLGEMFIDFTAGHASSGEAPAKHPFLGLPPNNLADVVPKVLEQLDPVIQEATATLTVLRATALNINRITAPEGQVQMTLAEFRQVGSNLNAATGPDGPLQTTLKNTAQLTSEGGKVSDALDNVRALTGPESSLAKTMKNAEVFTADLRNNQDLKLTLQNTRRATAGLNDTLGEIRMKFSAVAGNLEQASDTVKRQPWRLIWPSTKKYDEPSSATAPKPEPKPTRKRRSGR
jgi:ABC-type transporter Mla subunit MlaD